MVGPTDLGRASPTQAVVGGPLAISRAPTRNDPRRLMLWSEGCSREGPAFRGSAFVNLSRFENVYRSDLEKLQFPKRRGGLRPQLCEGFGWGRRWPLGLVSVRL